MGKIFYVMGKSASGKNAVYKQLRARTPELKTVRMHTTRPIRDGETNSVEYLFMDDGRLGQCRENDTLIERRTYGTVCGPWNYFTVDDGQIDLEHGLHLVVGTLGSYEKMRLFYESEVPIPLHIHVEGGLELRRVLEREEQQRVSRYRKVYRRFLADEEGFKLENLERCEIEKWYQDVVLEDCLKEIIGDIGMFMGNGKQGNAENS